MAQNALAHTQVDCIGMLCPLPILRLRKVLGTTPAGATLAFVATDPMVLVDVPVLCAEYGLEIVAQSQTDDRYHFLIQQAQAEGAAPSDLPEF